MKKLHILFAAFLSLPGLTAQVYSQLPSSCDVPDILRRYYTYDVANMAVGWMYTSHAPDTVQIAIPQWRQDSIWHGLAAIFNRPDLPAADTIFNKYCFHDPGAYIYPEISVAVDTSYPWTSNWMQGQTISGIPALDSLLLKNGFTITSFILNQYAQFLTPFTINIKMLCDSLESFPGILSAIPNIPGSNGPDPSTINFSDTGQNNLFTFRYAYGLNSHYIWKFNVHPDCSVEPLIVSNLHSEPFPLPLNCNIMDIPESEQSENSIEISPNPVQSIVTIKTTTPGSLVILNLDGRLLCNERISASPKEININSWPSGIYIVQIIKKNRVSFGKIVKE